MNKINPTMRTWLALSAPAAVYLTNKRMRADARSHGIGAPSRLLPPPTFLASRIPQLLRPNIALAEGGPGLGNDAKLA